MNFFVHIVESPSALDVLDARLEGRVLYQAIDTSGVQSTYLVACDKETFWEAIGNRLLDAIAQDSYQRWPFLHLSAHGVQSGIELTNRDFVTWVELTGYLRRLNRVLQGRLLLSVSSCHGAYAVQEVLKEGDHPYFALVGPADQIPLSDLAVGFSAFYHILSKTWDLHGAFEAMKIASGSNKFRLFITEQVKKDYEAWQLQQRVNQILLGMQQQNPLAPPMPGGGVDS